MGMKGMYFTLDAFLGALLLVGALTLVTQMHTSNPEASQLRQQSYDTLNILTELRVEEVDHPVVQEMITNGSIDNPNTTVLEQMGTFWARNETNNAHNLTRVVLEDVLPGKVGLSVHVENTQVFRQNTSSREQVVQTRQMLSGVEQGRAIRGSTAAPRLQRVRNKRTASYTYFGGFTGQGNLTVSIENVPSDVSIPSDITSVVMEGDVESAYDLHINGNFCDTFTPSSDSKEAERWNATSCADSVQTGDNLFELQFTGAVNESVVSGGFIKIGYTTDETRTIKLNGSETKHLPGVNGVINIFDGLHTPGNLTDMKVHLHYKVDEEETQPFFLDIANTTVYESNETGEITKTLKNSTLNLLLNYSQLDQRTVPLRLGFFQGNTSNSTGNISDVFLLTSRAGTMDEADIVGTSKTRMEVAKELGHVFVEKVLNNSGNRLGLASYFASSQIDDELTQDNTTLHNTIDDYDVQNPSNAERYLCQNIYDAKDELTSASSSRGKEMVMMTDGNATKCCSKGKCTPETARQDAIDAACDDYDTTGISIYTIGFGEGADRDMLEEIANCTDAEFRASSNYSGLKDIYEEFGAVVGAPSVVYDFQRANAANMDSTLYNDSHITLNYTPTVDQPRAGEMSLQLQSEQYNGCEPTVDIPDELRVLRAKTTSYSGDQWTKYVGANGNQAYNLTTFNRNYTVLGDPFTIGIPASYLSGGSNDLSIYTGNNESTDTGCSDNNTLIYRAAVNLTSGRTEVKEKADGCEWTVAFESGNQQTLTTPADYNGSDTCSYKPNSISYDADDSYDVATHSILRHLDFDDDGQVFVDFNEKDIEIAVDIIEEVPYLWGPAMVEVRVWR